MRLDIDVRWWHVVGGFFIAFVAVPYLLGTVWYYLKPHADTAEALFSDGEKAQLRALQPELYSLVLSQEDIGHVPGEFYDCTDPDIKAGVYYDTDDQGNDELDVTKARLDGESSRPRGDSEFCDDENGSWIASHASMETTKSELLHDLSILTELAKGKQEDVAAVLMPMAEYHARDGEVLDAEWLSTEGIGDASFGIQATVSVESGVYRVYRTTFIRGVVWAGITVRFPKSGDAPDLASGLVRAYDEKIESRLKVLADGATPIPTRHPSPTISAKFSGCLNRTGVVEIRGSNLFVEQIGEAMDALPVEYRNLVECWLTAIVEDTTSVKPGAGGFVRVISGEYHVLGPAVPHAANDVGAVADATGGMAHEAVHVREYWHGRPAEGRDGELTALKAQAEVLLKIPTWPHQILCLWELIDNIDDPAYQYWHGADPPCKAGWRGPPTQTPS